MAMEVMAGPHMLKSQFLPEAPSYPVKFSAIVWLPEIAGRCDAVLVRRNGLQIRNPA